MQHTEYLTAITTLVTDCEQTTGTDLPTTIKLYTISILAERLNTPNWQPDPSWAERYLTLRTAHEAKQLGDTALFAVAVFPTLGNRRGISKNYYTSIGQGAYSKAAEKLNEHLYLQLSEHFEFVANFMGQCVNRYPQKGNTLF